MRKLLFLFFCLFSLHFFAQEQQLAYQYFRTGEYKKAAALYKSLHKKNPYNTNYTTYLINSYQLLEEFDNAKKVIENQLATYKNQEYLYVELGYGLQLQHKTEEAIVYYNKALKLITPESNLGYNVAKSFQDNHLLDYALTAYKKAMEVNTAANYNYQIAAIYGEKADIENMFNTYLDMIALDDKYLSSGKNKIARFITDNPEDENNIFLKKSLLKRSQNNPQNKWNQLLSWLYMQQNEYNKALIQEKALFKRNAEGLNAIIDVGTIAFENKDYDVATNSFNFILEKTTNIEEKLTAKLYLLQVNMELDTENSIIEKQFQQLFNEYGKSIQTLSIQISYAEFLAFKKKESGKAISEFKQILKLPLNKFQNGYVKTKLADILVFNNQFSTALIYYTQVQNKLKNHEIGQTARFKIAQTSYFKGDFEWAQSQLKVLKNSTSQLIANDALDLNLLITDNTVKDSLKIALKKYATAELLAFQNKDQQAIDTLQVILTEFKEHSIIDEALFKQAKLFEKTREFNKAESNYLQLIEKDRNDILADDASYYLAELYLNHLNNIEKAKEYYQKIIFEYPSSIFLVDARKKFRKLRGDNLDS